MYDNARVLLKGRVGNREAFSHFLNDCLGTVYLPDMKICTFTDQFSAAIRIVVYSDLDMIDPFL